MGYVIPLGFSRVSFKHRAVSPVGSDITWGFGCDVTASQAFADDLVDLWKDLIQPSTSDVLLCETVEVRNDVAAFEAAVGETGDNDAAYPPPQSAALVRLSSGLTGRSNRGRIYVPYFINEANLETDGRLTTTALANLQGRFDDIATFLATFDATFCILHSTSSDPTPVTSVVASGQIATQRRRNRR